VHGPEHVLGQRVALLGGLAELLGRLGIVLGDAVAVGIHQGKAYLAYDVSLLGQRKIQLKSCNVIPTEICSLAIF
jgi:hypothetical protein